MSDLFGDAPWLADPEPQRRRLVWWQWVAAVVATGAVSFASAIVLFGRPEPLPAVVVRSTVTVAAAPSNPVLPTASATWGGLPTLFDFSCVRDAGRVTATVKVVMNGSPGRATVAVAGDGDPVTAVFAVEENSATRSVWAQVAGRATCAATVTNGVGPVSVSAVAA